MNTPEVSSLRFRETSEMVLVPKGSFKNYYM